MNTLMRACALDSVSARRSAQRGYCCRRVSVTCRYCIETDNDSIKLFIGLVAPPLWFSNATCGCDILTGRRASNTTELRYFRPENA